MPDAPHIEMNVGRQNIKISHVDRLFNEVKAPMPNNPEELHRRAARIDYAGQYADRLGRQPNLNTEVEYKNVEAALSKKMKAVEAFSNDELLKTYTEPCDAGAIDREENLDGLPIPHLAARLSVLGYLKRFDDGTPPQKLEKIKAQRDQLLFTRFDTTRATGEPRRDGNRVTLPGIEKNKYDEKKLSAAVTASPDGNGRRIIYYPHLDEQGNVNQFTRIEMTSNQARSIRKVISVEESKFKAALDLSDAEKQKILAGVDAFLVKRRLKQENAPPVMFGGMLLESGPHVPALEENRQKLPREIGLRFDGHGIARQSNSELLESLLTFLTKGVDTKRRFDHRRLRYLEKGTDDDPGFTVPFTDGAFIIVGLPDQKITEGGIGGVLVNEHFYHAVPLLQERFPNVKFIRVDQMNEGLTQMIREKK